MLRIVVTWLGAAVIGMAGLAAGAGSEPVGVRPEVQAPHRFDARLRETTRVLPVEVRTADGRRHRTEFQLTYYRPAGDGPFPLVVLSHGRGPDRAWPSRERSLVTAGYFVRRGFAVLVPTRVGFGGFGIRLDPEVGGPACSLASADLQIDAVEAHARAALAYAAAQPWADPDRVLLAGQSVGGYTSIAIAARGLPGVRAVINFAGGVGARASGTDAAKRKGMLCPERVPAVFARAGRTLKQPTLWLYARDDAYWGEAAPKAWHATFVGAGGRADFVPLPPIGGDGHSALSSSHWVWRATVDPFLVQHFAVTVPRIAEAPPPSRFARLDEVERLPVETAASRDAYRRFLRGDLPRAFVVGPGTAWSYVAGSRDALAEAMKSCAGPSARVCRPYAVDDAVVWAP